MDDLRCGGPKRGDERLFPDRCGEPASYRSAAGFRCEYHAELEMEAIREGSSIVAMVAEQRGVPKERLLAQYVRIQ